MSTNNTPVNKGHFDLDTKERVEEFGKKMSTGWDVNEYKKYRQEWFDFPQAKKIREYPLQVDLELSSACNLKCPMCYTITDEFKNNVSRQFMDFDLVKRIIDEVAGKVYALRLSWRGEATLHPNFIEIIQYAKSSGIKEVSFLTNAGKLDLDFFVKIANAGADWISISIDGTGETYNNIRKPLKFEETLAKIKAIKEYKDINGLIKPVIKIQSIWPAIRQNPEEYYNTFAPYVDLIAFNPLIDYLHNDSEILYEDNFSCPQLYERVFVSSTGEVVLCNGDENGNYIIGNADNETIYDIWHGEKLNKIRDLHRQKDGFMSMDICRRCFYPRKTAPNESAIVNGREVVIENYINRQQEVGK